MVRVGVVELAALPLECAFEGASPVMPRGVRAWVRGRWILVAADRAASEAGIRVGMTESEARARCPDLDVRDQRRERERERLEAAAETMLLFSSEVEVQPPNIIAMELSASRASLATTLGANDEPSIAVAIRQRLAERGHEAAIAIADDVETAQTLVRSCATKTPASVEHVVRPGESRRALAPLPLMALAWTDRRRDPDQREETKLVEAVRIAHTLGWKTVRDMLLLFERALPARFEAAGRTLLRRARAEVRRPLEAYVPPPEIRESFDLEQGTDELEPLLFVVRRLLSGLCARLQARHAATAEVKLVLDYEPDHERTVDAGVLRPRSSRRRKPFSFSFARPTRDPKLIFEIMREQLAVIGFVRSLVLEATAVTSDPGLQLDLFHRAPKKIEEAAGLISRLQARLGPDAVGAAELVDTHRPENAWRLVPFDFERALAEPRVEKRSPAGPQLVRLPWSEPVELSSLPDVDERLSVTGCAAPVTENVSSSVRAWPKPIPRKAEDEPPPPLPPRPSRLAENPEPLRSKHGLTLTTFERLEGEWWCAEPLQRDYRVGVDERGRRLWVFEAERGRTYVHGWFD